MPPGNNRGGQLNLFMFELGMVRSDPLGILPDIVTTLAVHPMVVVPSTIVYQDESRSALDETHDGAILTKDGRRLRSVTFTGTFGVKSRGLGPYIGTGELRFRKFYHEIVRLGDATTKGAVKDAKDFLRSPILSALLSTYDETTCKFYVNFYDFWHNVSFHALPQSFRFQRGGPRSGAATGQISYTLQCREAGPLVTGAFGTKLIDGLFKALKVWDTANEVIKSYTLDAIAGSMVDAAGIVVGQFVDTVNAVKAQIDGAEALLNGYAQPEEAILGRTRGLFGGGQVSGSKGTASSTAANSSASSRSLQAIDDDPANGRTGLSAYLGNTTRLAQASTSLRDTMRAQSGGAPALKAPAGTVRWEDVEGEGDLPELQAADVQDSLSQVAAAATFQASVGSFYGLSRAEFERYLASTGRAGREAALAGSTRHVVASYDTPSRIEERYRVPWDTILRLNDLLPREAMITGTVLLIPQQRQVGAPSPINGLPVFGSHAGTEALGRDLYAYLRVVDGRLQVAEADEAITQGIDWIVADHADRILAAASEVPEVGLVPYLRATVTGLIAGDRRISSVDQVTITRDPATASITMDVVATAINGATVDTAQVVR